ncbi:MAG: hypothetical protein QOJ16_2698, partial [Acidobacteriota bacterium]|nr:hypothetical protein [Acidobacteriota bacterium]
MNARILILIALVVTATPLSAQQEGSVWYFGKNAGLDFKIGNPPPTAIAGNPNKMDTSEGCSVISDLTGAVRFYTDGNKVWDRRNQVMQNGSGLQGDSSATQSALIVPWPGDCTRYFIFTVGSAEQGQKGDPHGLFYSVVDMNLNGGLGGLVPNLKNTPLQPRVSEKLTAVRDAGPALGYWVVSHGFSSTSATAPEATRFYAYHITTSGLSPTPVTSSVGSAHFRSDYGNAQGQMK